MVFKIAVITPLFAENLAIVDRCRQSVLDQYGRNTDFQVDHWWIADGGPTQIEAGPDDFVVKLPRNNNDFGNTPRGIGGVLVRAQSTYDFVMYLDADNFISRDRIKMMLQDYVSSGGSIICSRRIITDLTGAELSGVTDSDEDKNYHVDTNCWFFHKGAFSLLDFWLRIPKQLSVIGDRIFFQHVKRCNYSLFFCGRRDVYYSSNWVVHYELASQAPPVNAKRMSSDHLKWISNYDNLIKTVDLIGFAPEVRSHRKAGARN